MKRFLITTALEATWRKNIPILFLGEWCRLYKNKKQWIDLDAEILPYHWDDNSKFCRDYKYLKIFYEHVLIQLSKKLNQIHSVRKSTRYWRILVGPWLAYFIQILFDRWSSLQNAVTYYDLSETIVLVGQDKEMIANDMGHFTRLMVTDEWNQHVFSHILKNHSSVTCVKKPYYQNPGTKKFSELPSNKERKKQSMMRFFGRILGCLMRQQDALLIKTGLTLLDDIRLNFRLKQIPQSWRWRSVEPPRSEILWEQREWVLTGETNSEFEKCALSFIPKQIPALFIEGYDKLIKQINTVPYPGMPSVIFSSNMLWDDTVCMAYAAGKAESGTPIVCGQHGGVYGTAKLAWTEEHELRISNCFLSWGWNDIEKSNITPVGILKPILSFCESIVGGKKLLLVLASQSRYSYRISSEPRSSKILNGFKNSFRFVELLPKLIQHHLLVRPYMHEYGWDQYLRWKDRFSEISIDSGDSKMSDLLTDARIAVFNYNSTGFLETFATNIPTVLFWNPNDSPLRESAIPYFMALKKVGIYHETPESAAKHVSKIWCSVGKWWNSPKVQEARAHFCRQYAYLPKDLLGRLEKTLRNVMGSKEHQP